MNKINLRSWRDDKLLEMYNELSTICLIGMDSPDVLEGSYHEFNKRIEDSRLAIAGAIEYLRSMKFSGE